MSHFPRISLSAFIYITILMGLTACQPQTATQSSPATPEPVASVVVTPSVDQARQIVLNALLVLNTTPNQMNNTTTTADGKVHQNVIEFVPPDRKRIAGEGTEIIVAGGKVYLKSSETSPWQLLDMPASTYLGDQPVTQESLAGIVQGAEFVRNDALNGREMEVFHYTSDTTASGVNLHSQVELWVDPTNGLPGKMITDGETLAVSTDPATGENKASAEKTLTTTLIEFLPSLQIEAPLQ